MKIFYAFIIMVTAAILFMLPVTEGIYDFITDVREDTFTVTTGVGSTNATVQLFKAIYDDDTNTIELSSNDADDIPLYSSYNATNRNLVVTGLSENITRTLTVNYDIDALSNSAAVATLVSKFDLIWLLVVIAFPAAAIAAIVIGRA